MTVMSEGLLLNTKNCFLYSEMIPVSFSFFHCLFLYFSFLCYVTLFILLL